MAKRVFKGLRLHIGLFGRRNVGKSSLLNAMTRQYTSIVSDIAGTTTDPVEKPMELLPLGPVVFIDTAGIDDEGALGTKRVEKSKKVIERTDLGVIVIDPGQWDVFEERLLAAFSELGTPVIVVANKVDLKPVDQTIRTNLKDRNITLIETVARDGQGILEFRQALLDHAPFDFLDNPPLIRDLVGPGDIALLVVPIDKEAPKGRIILPQVQTIRDLLDGDAMALVVKETRLKAALEAQKVGPAIVITDSQAFVQVAADTPVSIKITSFSILFSRYKGDLTSQVAGTLAVDSLKPGDRVLIAEACSHHPIADDIGRVKIPRWLSEYVGGQLDFTWVQGHDFPDDPSEYKLVIHCGACMFNRKAMLSRILRCRSLNVPITNYGLVIAFSLGIFARALEPFPDALELYRSARAHAAR
ncbi:[FeFe] hydrogenase H-cluster maturation GTPase HydF [bacterium]|nr:[FeFe] hydrogenase H-cluster maturation GTPase HydF [bacterium]